MFGGKISVTNYPKLNLASKHISKSSKGPKITIYENMIFLKNTMVGNTVGKSPLPQYPKISKKRSMIPILKNWELLVENEAWSHLKAWKIVLEVPLLSYMGVITGLFI